MHRARPSLGKRHGAEEPLGSPVVKPGEKVVFQAGEVRAGCLDRPADCLPHRLANEQTVQELVGGPREFVMTDHVALARDRKVDFSRTRRFWVLMAAYRSEVSVDRVAEDEQP